MRRAFVILLTLILAFSFCGCGKEESKATFVTKELKPENIYKYLKIEYTGDNARGYKEEGPSGETLAVSTYNLSLTIEPTDEKYKFKDVDIGFSVLYAWGTNSFHVKTDENGRATYNGPITFKINIENYGGKVEVWQFRDGCCTPLNVTGTVSYEYVMPSADTN